MVHDFMKWQPSTISGVDLFVLRTILHNWLDKCAVHILRSPIPIMKPIAKVLVNDIVISKPNTLI